MAEQRPDAPSRPAVRSPLAWSMFLILCPLLLWGDLWLKAWAMAHLPDSGIDLIPHLLSLRWTENHGAIFGTLQGARPFFIVASLVATGLIFFFFAQSRAHERAVHLGLALILAGAMGNMYDRIAHGFVRDMLLLFPDVKLPFGWRWWGGSEGLYPWIFNLADVYLLVGIAIVLLRSLLCKDHADRSSDAQSDP